LIRGTDELFAILATARRIPPYTHHNGKVGRYQRILAQKSFTPAFGPQKLNELKRSKSGISASTAIDHSLPPQANFQYHN
jgi:hypothetical protein